MHRRRQLDSPDERVALPNSRVSWRFLCVTSGPCNDRGGSRYWPYHMRMVSEADEYLVSCVHLTSFNRPWSFLVRFYVVSIRPLISLGFLVLALGLGHV